MAEAEPGRNHKYRDAWWRALGTIGDLSPGERTVALLVSTHARADGTRALVSAAMLSAESGTGESTVRRHLASLVKRRLIVRTSRGGRDGSGKARASIYSLTISTAQSGEQLSEVSTARSDEQLSDGLNRSIDASQPLDPDVSTAHPGERPPSSPPSNPPSVQHLAELDAALRRAGIPSDALDEIVAVASRDPETRSPVGRLVGSRSYLQDVWATVAHQRKFRTRIELDAAPRCDECSQPVPVCEAYCDRNPGWCDGAEQRRQLIRRESA